jgi:iron complex transport system ATP-binding protein
MSDTSSSLFNLERCSFGYTATPVLEDIAFHLDPGRFYGLLGPNGSGKTSLLDLMSGVTAARGGQVRFRGREVRSYTKAALAREMAIVPQDLSIGFDYSVFEVVLMGRHPFIPRFARPTQTDLGLVESAISEMDIGHLRTRSVTQLSGGEKQRVLVARALAQNTGVLLLDEPTASLDIRHTLDIMLALRQRVSTKAITVIATIHDLDLAAVFCDELIVLSKGRLYEHGPVSSVMTERLIREVFTAEARVSSDPLLGKPRVQYRYDYA